MLTPNLTVTITQSKLIYAIGIIEGLKLGNPKVTQAVIDKELESQGFTIVEVYLIKSVSMIEVIKVVFNPPVHHRKGRKPGAKGSNVQSTLDANEPPHGWDSDADETLEDNELSV